jgi:hypothetical protein
MYQFSRAIYRELEASILAAPSGTPPGSSRAAVLHACERVIERLATERDYIARPERTLFSDIRSFFPIRAQGHVRRVVGQYITYALAFLDAHPHEAYMAVTGEPPVCRATTRKGEACRRRPLAHSSYCPGHRRLALSEKREQAA